MKTVCETGIVQSTGNGTAIVRLTGDQSCRKCGLAAIGLCTVGGTGMEIEARCQISVAPGQKVRVSRGGRSMTDGGFVIYGVPVAALIGGALLGGFIAPSLGVSADAGATGGGFLLMFLSLLPVWLWGKRQDKSARFKPVIREVVDPHDKRGNGWPDSWPD
ncbi:MAG: SoxR reducing system RseC family protein [Nitrospirae bacterium]|nr:SoxR reducing system RseC family protein [Nitrospirota bacterium]